MSSENERNPIILPESAPKRRGCPKCGHPDFNGRRVMGVVTFTCKDESCKNQWQGGLPQEPLPPDRPLPPNSHNPALQFFNVYDKSGVVVDMVEERRRESPNPAFRGGALIPDGED